MGHTCGERLLHGRMLTLIKFALGDVGLAAILDLDPHPPLAVEGVPGVELAGLHKMNNTNDAE